MKHFIEQLISGHRFTRQEASALMERVIECSSVEQQAAVLSLLQTRALSLEELQGYSDSLIERAIRYDLGADLIDVCGTGGDNKNTFNISTATAFVVAGAGVRVAKHGNYGSSSLCGSSNVIEALGIPLTSERAVLQRCLEEANICYLHAPLFHPSLRGLSQVRRALGVRTVFNVLGPLLNPVKPRYRMVGVARPELLRLFTYYLSANEGEFAVVHSRDGYDEISLTESADIYMKNSSYTVNAKQLGLEKVAPRDLSVHTREESIEVFLRVLRGEGTRAQEGVVLANAAVAIQVVLKRSLPECFALARESIASGRALQCVKTIQAVTN